MQKSLLLTLVLIIASSVSVQADQVAVGYFDSLRSAPPGPWRVVKLSDKFPATGYQVIEWDGISAVEAVAEASMALLARPLEIDLEKTPVLCWRWRIDAPLVSADMTRKSGDDYAARVYVSFKLPSGELGFGTRIKLGIARSIFGEHVPDAAINYIWDNNNPVGTQRPNAYTDRTQMFVLQTGADNAGSWVIERRNVLTDYYQAFGEVDGLSAVQLAVASDTDNTGETARAGFADIHFVEADSQCDFP